MSYRSAWASAMGKLAMAMAMQSTPTQRARDGNQESNREEPRIDANERKSTSARLGLVSRDSRRIVFICGSLFFTRVDDTYSATRTVHSQDVEVFFIHRFDRLTQIEFGRK